MSRLIPQFAALCGGAARVLLAIAGAGLVVMTLVIGWQIFGRYALNDTPHWSERLSVYLMLYYIMFGAAVGVRDRIHIGLVFLHDLLPRRGRIALDLFSNVLVGAFGGALGWYGLEIAMRTWNQTIPTLGIPTGTSYLAFPIAGAAIVLFSIEHILRSLSGQEVKRGWS